MFSPVFVRSFSHYSHLLLKRLLNFVYIYLSYFFFWYWLPWRFCENRGIFVPLLCPTSEFKALMPYLVKARKECAWEDNNNKWSFLYWTHTYVLVRLQSAYKIIAHTHTHTHTLSHTHTYTPLHTHAYTHILSITHYSFVQTSAIVSRLSCICFHSLFLENFVGIFGTFWVNWIFWIIHAERKM